MGVADFIDLVYAYAINAPQVRNEARSSMLGYLYQFNVGEVEGAEDMSFEGFQKSSLSMLDELDAFQLG